MTENEGLKREIGLWGLVANSVNIIIGAGIFMLPVIVAERLGSASISAYAICGGLMILIMLCFAEAGSKITLTGGAYTYIETAFGRFAGFITANIFIFGAAVTANAAVANGLADTLSYFFPLFDQRWFRILFFAMMFGGFAYFNVRGVKNAIFIVKFNTIAKLLPLLMIITLGWLFIEPSKLEFTLGNPLNDLGEITLVLLFAFVGAETALNVSGEIRRPERTIPAGIMLSILFVVVLYIMIQVVVQAILGDSITLHHDAPLTQTAFIMFGVTGASIVVIGAVFSMFGNISGMVLNMPRILFAASRDRVIPVNALSSIHPVFRTPHVSVIVYAILGFLFAAIGEFRQLAMLSSASYMLIYLGVVLAVIKFSLTTTYKSKGILTGYVIPFISAGVIIWVLTKLPLNELTGMIVFILILAVIYGIIRITGKHKPSSRN